METTSTTSPATDTTSQTGPGTSASAGGYYSNFVNRVGSYFNRSVTTVEKSANTPLAQTSEAVTKAVLESAGEISGNKTKRKVKLCGATATVAYSTGFLFGPVAGAGVLGTAYFFPEQTERAIDAIPNAFNTVVSTLRSGAGFFRGDVIPENTEENTENTEETGGETEEPMEQDQTEQQLSDEDLAEQQTLQDQVSKLVAEHQKEIEDAVLAKHLSQTAANQKDEVSGSDADMSNEDEQIEDLREDLAAALQNEEKAQEELQKQQELHQELLGKSLSQSSFLEVQNTELSQQIEESNGLISEKSNELEIAQREITILQARESAMQEAHEKEMEEQQKAFAAHLASAEQGKKDKLTLKEKKALKKTARSNGIQAAKKALEESKVNNDEETSSTRPKRTRR